MSYDFRLQANSNYSVSHDIESTVAYLLDQANVKSNGKRGFVLDDPPSRWMEIYLETVSDEGDSIEDGNIVNNTFNCVNLCIPYGFLENQPVDSYYPLIKSLAQHLRWEAINLQTDLNLNHIPKTPWWKIW